MRTIIAGSRDFRGERLIDYEEVVGAVVDSEFDVTVVLSGTARGVDTLAIRLSEEFNIPLEKYPAAWDVYGRYAGFKRNEQMARNAEALIAVWDGQSKGTKHMINVARSLGLKVYVAHITP